MDLFFIQRDALKSDRVVIIGPDAHHISRVLRMAEGEEILLSDGMETACRVRIVRTGRGGVECQVVERQPIPPEKSPRIVLGQAIPKGDKMDVVVKKSTELGVSAIYPIHTRRSVPKPSPAPLRRREERWRRISVEASKQCGRLVPPDIHPSTTLETFLESHRGADIGLFLWEGETRQGLRDLLRKVNPPGPSGAIAVVVGPEGGFDDGEVVMASSFGFRTVSLGKRRLRTETVSLTVLSIIQYELGDLGSP